jgi:hypothetical protein
MPMPLVLLIVALPGIATVASPLGDPGDRGLRVPLGRLGAGDRAVSALGHLPTIAGGILTGTPRLSTVDGAHAPAYVR